MAVRLVNSKTQNNKISTKEIIINSKVNGNEIEFEADLKNKTKSISNSSDNLEIDLKPTYIADIIHHRHILNLIK